MADFGTRYEHECYDIGHLYNLAHFLDRKLAKPPLFIQSVFGILGGIGTDPDNVMFMRRTADRLFGKDYVWSVLAAGRHQMPLITQAAMLGGNVRVGLEDSLYIGRGKLAASNAAQVSKIRQILERTGLRDRDAGRSPADPGAEGPRPGQDLKCPCRRSPAHRTDAPPTTPASTASRLSRARRTCCGRSRTSPAA